MKKLVLNYMLLTDAEKKKIVGGNGCPGEVDAEGCCRCKPLKNCLSDNIWIEPPWCY